MPRWPAIFSVYYYRQVKELHHVDVPFTCASSPPHVNMHSVTSSLNKWPWARCAPRMFRTSGSRRRLFAVLEVKRVESYPPQGGPNWLCEIQKESGQRQRWGRPGPNGGRRGGIFELTRGEKWENWSISPPWILSIYDQRDKERTVYSLCQCWLPRPMSDTQSALQLGASVYRQIPSFLTPAHACLKGIKVRFKEKKLQI